jgi:hypothetical protein
MNFWEPEWFKSIPSESICGYFYIMFLIIAVAAAIIVFADLSYIVSARGRGGFMLLLRSLIALALPLINALFLYILCSRSLLSKK